MMANSVITPKPKKYFAQKFALWIGLVSMFMAFAGLTSAYIFRRADSDWLEFNLPIQFTFSTITIVLSSVTIMLANHYYKQDEFKKFRQFLIATFVLGIIFFILQLLGWEQMKKIGVPIVGNGSPISGSFVGIISLWHVAHLLGGLFFLLIAIVRSFFIFKQDPTRILVKEFAPAKGIRMDLLTTYWHFVDAMWLYLFIFFIINK